MDILMTKSWSAQNRAMIRVINATLALYKIFVLLPVDFCFVTLHVLYWLVKPALRCVSYSLSQTFMV